jgi:putative membrane protein
VKIKSLLFATALAIPVLASAQAPHPDTTTPPAGSKADSPDQKTPAKPPATTDKNASNDKAKAGSLSNDDVMIVAHVHHVNVMEQDMGKQAKLKGTAAVKRYGEMLIKDHSTADKDLAAMTKKKGLTKIPADQPQTEAEKQEMKDNHDKMMSIAKLKGADFDRAYLQMMVDGHEKELAKSDDLISKASDADLKSMLESRKSTLQRHADAAKELQKGTAQASTEPQATPKTRK